MSFKTRTTRRGFSLLELLVAVTLLVSAVTAVSVLLRVNYATWLEYRGDNLRQESATGVLRHLVRQIRQCEEVEAISLPSDSSGALTVRMPSGNLIAWDHNGTNVHYGTNAPTQLLGNQITGLTFEGFAGDGVTPTVVPSDVQCVRVTVSYTLPERNPAARSLTATAWIRAF